MRLSQCRTWLLILLCAVVCSCSEVFAQEKLVDEATALAGALIEMRGDERAWTRGAAVLALCAELGIPEERFWREYPGLKRDSIPPPVLKELCAGAASLPTWMKCVEDARPTGIVENDLFGGGSSKDARKLTCGEAAGCVVGVLVPSEVFTKAAGGEKERKKADAEAKAAERSSTAELPPTPEQQAVIKKRIIEAVAGWDERLRALPPNERLTAWFAAADER